MGFGNNFYPVYEKQSTQLENGLYTVRIKTAEVKQFNNGNEYMDVQVEVKDQPDCTPNRIQLYEAPVLGSTKYNGEPVSKEDVDRANGKITRFFQCFGIAIGDFDLTHWKNKVGVVKCAEQYDAKEADKKSKKYKEFTPQVKLPSAIETPAPKPAAAKKEEPVKEEPFSEDIPF